jgi:translation initiation factor IF-1
LGEKMEKGIKVTVNLEDGTKSEGYIVRRLNANSYEVWIEKEDKTLYLCPKEFTEVNKGK